MRGACRRACGSTPERAIPIDRVTTRGVQTATSPIPNPYPMLSGAARWIATGMHGVDHIAMA